MPRAKPANRYSDSAKTSLFNTIKHVVQGKGTEKYVFFTLSITVGGWGQESKTLGEVLDFS